MVKSICSIYRGRLSLLSRASSCFLNGNECLDSTEECFLEVSQSSACSQHQVGTESSGIGLLTCELFHRSISGDCLDELRKCACAYAQLHSCIRLFVPHEL